MSIDLLTFDANKHWFDQSFEYPIKKKFRLPKCFKKTFYLNELFAQYPESTWDDFYYIFFSFEEVIEVESRETEKRTKAFYKNSSLI